jgi:hypothetical protein
MVMTPECSTPPLDTVQSQLHPCTTLTNYLSKMTSFYSLFCLSSCIFQQASVPLFCKHISLYHGTYGRNSEGFSPSSSLGGPGSVPGWYLWDLWCTKRYCSRFIFEHSFSFHLPFHQRSIVTCHQGPIR